MATEIRKKQAARAIAELLEQLLRVVESQALAQGINPVHWTALRYFSQANKSARTVGSFGKYHMTTPSSASQTISALVKKKLLAKSVGKDSRVRRIELTALGRKLLEDDPNKILVGAIETLSEEQLATLANVVEQLMRTASAANEPDSRKSS